MQKLFMQCFWTHAHTLTHSHLTQKQLWDHIQEIKISRRHFLGGYIFKTEQGSSHHRRLLGEVSGCALVARALLTSGHSSHTEEWGTLLLPDEQECTDSAVRYNRVYSILVEEFIVRMHSRHHHTIESGADTYDIMAPWVPSYEISVTKRSNTSPKENVVKSKCHVITSN